MYFLYLPYRCTIEEQLRDFSQSASGDTPRLCKHLHPGVSQKIPYCASSTVWHFARRRDANQDGHGTNQGASQSSNRLCPDVGHHRCPVLALPPQLVLVQLLSCPHFCRANSWARLAQMVNAYSFESELLWTGEVF